MSTVTVPHDDCVVMDGVSWATYEGLLADRQERRRPRMAYDRGVLELMSPGVRHDSLARLVTLLVAAVVEVWDLDMVDVGSTTFKDEEWAKGFEADACFFVRTAAAIRDKDDLDVRADPPPDIVFEVDITSSSLDKLPIYHRFGVAEVWRHDGRRVTVLARTDDGYAPHDDSVVLPGLTAHDLTRLLNAGRRQRLGEWLAQVRAWARTVTASG